MGSLYCDLCGTFFDPSEPFMTANVEIQSETERRTITQLTFCGRCASTAEDTLSIGTARRRV
jgi:hypothetical protein